MHLVNNFPNNKLKNNYNHNYLNNNYYLKKKKNLEFPLKKSKKL